MVGFEGRENVRSTLGFLESMRPLGVTVKKEARKTEVQIWFMSVWIIFHLKS